MEEYHQRPRRLISYKNIYDEIYTRHGIARDPLGYLVVQPRWISDTALIAHETMSDGWLINPYLIDLKQRHPVIKLTGLGKQILGSRGAPWQVSSDSRWVLWPKGDPDPNWLCATRIDGNQHISFWEVSYWEGFFGWLPGNHPVYITSAASNTRWTSTKEVPRKATAFIYDLHQSRPIQRIPLPPLEETEWAGVSHKGMIVLAGLSAPNHATIAQIGLSGGRATLHRNTIALPLPTEESNFMALLSPDGQRVLWQLGKGDMTQLLISSLEGKRFVRLRVDRGRDFQWLPSGKAISFLSSEDGYRNDLYTLEVG